MSLHITVGPRSIKRLRSWPSGPFLLLLLLLIPEAHAQNSTPQVGREVAVPVHLQDGEEFTTPMPRLIQYGEKLFSVRYCLVKVLLTVSLLRSSILQPLVVHPTNNRFSTPLFSASSELLFPQLLSFQNHLRRPLVFSNRAPLESSASASSAKSFIYRFYAKSPANPFI
jgi:hypothetical protein